MNLVPFDASQVFIAGRWRAGDSGQTLPLINPSDGSELTRIARGNAADIDAAVRAAQVALEGEGGIEGERAGAWGRLTATERGRILLKMSALVLEQADELARLEALDVGKPLKQGRADAVALSSTAARLTRCTATPSRLPTATPPSPCASLTA
jgi:aldehyde dehydrogenase (NAD+)